MENNKISIKFEFTDENNNFYSAESRMEVFDEFASVLDELGMAFNNFLKQAGYTYFDKEYLLMKSLDGDEYEALEAYLEEYRARANTKKETEND